MFIIILLALTGILPAESFLYFGVFTVKMGTGFPLKVFCVFVSFLFSRPGFFGIKGNHVNFNKFKAYFLLSYGSMIVLPLFKGVFTVLCL